jgi:hypothetical protein
VSIAGKTLQSRRKDIMSITISRTVMEELRKSLARDPELETPRGSLYISRNVPASCIRLSVPRKEYLRFLMDLQGFKQAYKVIPVDEEPFDIVVLGSVAVECASITIDGKVAPIL